MTRQQQRTVEAFRSRSYFNGMGDARPLTSAIGSGLVTAGGVLAMVPAVGPVIGGIVAAVGAMTSLIGSLFQPDITKIQATRIVDQIEAEYLKPNLAQWQALPPEMKTRSVQAAALELVDKALAGVRQGCSNPALGTAGQNCISERLNSSACHWTLDGRTPGQPPDCGNWITWFRDPIANDPEVHADSSAIDSISNSVSSFFGGGSSQGVGGIPIPLLIGAALLAIAFAVMD